MQRRARVLVRSASALVALAFIVLAPSRSSARATADSTPTPQIVVLAYHEIDDNPAAPLQTVSAEFLREQIRACRALGWTFLSLPELLARSQHMEQLPARVMVLTFDDGYRSFRDRALPVLLAERVRATLAPISSFVGTEHPELGPLLDWSELRALDSTHAVDFASHSHALHEYVMNDPQRDTAPSAVTRRWLSDEKRYENREEYRSRLWADLNESQGTFQRELGRKLNLLVWPYGVHNDMTRAQAAEAGFMASLSLEPRFVTRADLARRCLPRVMVTRRMDFSDPKLSWLHEDEGPVRAAEIDLEALWDPDELVFRARLDQAVTRARAMGATEVVLPFAPDPRRDGQVRRAYAMNHQIPLLADIWTMAASKFIAAQMRLWVRVPTLDQTWTWERRPEWRLKAAPGSVLADRWTTRLSPEVPEVRINAANLLADLAVYLPISGVVFDGDLAVSTQDSLAIDRAATSSERVRLLRGIVEECKSQVRAWRPLARFARLVPAAAVDRGGADPATSIDLDECFVNDDIVVIEDGAALRDASPVAVERFARRVSARWRNSGRKGPPSVMLMLPARARNGAGLSAARQQGLATAALRGGLVHLGTSPVQAQGELPLGLLDTRLNLPTTRAASKRR